MNTVVPNPQKELVVNFTIDAVKKSIRDVCLVKGKFKMYKDNDILNTFIIHSSTGVGLNDYVISISLIPISETQTKILCEVSQQLGNTHSTIIAAGFKMRLDEFLEVMSKFLSGESKVTYLTPQEAKAVKKANSKTNFKKGALGCLGIIILIVVIIVLIGLIHKMTE